MSQWFLMLIYIVHGDQIGPIAVADLYPDQEYCVRVLASLQLSPKQHGVCLPVATMTRQGVTVTQPEWLAERLREETHR